MIYGYIKNVPSGGGGNGGWSRPSEWLTQPTIGDENVVWALMAVFLGDENPFTHNCLASSGVTTEFYDDVTSSVPFATYTTNNNIFVGWDDCTSVEYNGYKMCWAKIFPTNPSANFNSIDFYQPHSVLGNYSSQVLEMLISTKTTSPDIIANHRLGVDAQTPSMIHSVEYFNKVVIASASLYNYAYGAKALQNIKCHTPCVITGDVKEMFSAGCSLVTPPINATFKPTPSLYNFQYNGLLSFIEIDFTNPLYGLYDCMRNANASYINCYNMTGTTEALNIVGSLATKRIIFGGYKQSFNVSQAGIRGEAQFMELAESLGTTTAGTLTMTAAQYASFGGLGSPVDDELFDKGWTIVPV